MCYAAAIPWVIGGLSTAATLYGSAQSANAQSKAASALSQQNLETQRAQGQAFASRMGAQSRQADAQFGISQQELADRAANATAMRTNQAGALNQQAQILAAENAQAERLRQVADQQNQQTLDQTSGAALDATQQAAQAQAAALLAGSATGGQDPNSPGATSPDDVTQAAMSRRMAQAASNIRSYGEDIARVGSYQQPLQDVGRAITDNRSGIMPAQMADQLLRSGASTRLLPSQIAYQSATGLGGAQDTLISSAAQGRRDVAGLDFGNTLSIANLGQQDANVLAANKAAQAKQDAQWQQQIGGLVSSLGQLGAYGVGYKYGGPEFMGSNTGTGKVG